MRRNKFNAKKCVMDNIAFDSKAEACRYSELKILDLAGKIDELELQPRFNIEINGKHICYYKADFMYLDMDTGKRVVEDVKGYKKGAAYQLFKLKKKLVEAIHGITIVEC